ncbi:hypothetical protein IC582_018302 [Cucumis melo]|uniref:Uncharacterized protein LOC103484926 n=3 Tax=Cucumis melo TaxID=3656 RepID=A0A1S3B1B3_CUCME|nr:uncharacterized protein LOC103484926 [Cucumis melo]KAA0036350.1 Transcription initiation factor TFIID subunit 8, putative isoform 1 [Cucumis melo var. makuwa]TYK12744.1 Transcription initiation factor TFIID subunit 8, putative isoform 1 [Cucumis melo var. makuwa]
MALLGDDGRGYELARKLETLGVWRTWLGDFSYSIFVPFLSSTSTWDTFMRTDDSKSRAQIQLQLRARALLFDKASVSLFLRSTPSPSSPSYSTGNSLSSSSLAISKLNPNYLQLHGDDVYFTLENSSKDGVQQREGHVSSNKASGKIQPKAASSAGPRSRESDIGDSSQRLKNELPEAWYSQFIEKYRVKQPYRLSHGNNVADKRTSEEMSSYLRLLEKHKKRRTVFKDDLLTNFGNSVSANASSSVFDFSNSVEDDANFFPEIMFTFNCVPESALPPPDDMKDNRKPEISGVIDTLPQPITRNSAMMERLGVKPDYVSTERGVNVHRAKSGSGGNRKSLGQEQSFQMSQKVVARMLMSLGFEGATEVPLEVFSQFLSCHICKLGSTLRVLADSYRKQCSAVDLLRMFLKTMGYSNFGPLADIVKDGSRNYVRQSTHHGVQPQLQAQHQTLLQVPQQVPRQMHPQMQQMVHTQAFQQQQQQQFVLEKMRRRQAATPRAVMEANKDRPLLQVKVENTELPMDGNALNALNIRHPQLQFRQQQIAAMSNIHASPGNQFRQMPSMQMPQIQTPNTNVVRAPPVKVEGFQELMGGDSSSKHDSEEARLTSPSSK